jgi:hypothetical protein
MYAIKQSGAPPFALFERWDSTTPSLVGFLTLSRRLGRTIVRCCVESDVFEGTIRCNIDERPYANR